MFKLKWVDTYKHYAYMDINIYNIFVMLCHGGSVIPNFVLPIIGLMIKIEIQIAGKLGKTFQVWLTF